MAPILAYYTNFVFVDHPVAPDFWHQGALELIILALMQFRLVAEPSAVGYDCCDPCTACASCSVITFLLRGFQHCIDSYGFPQSVSECAFDPTGAYPVYAPFAEI